VVCIEPFINATIYSNVGDQSRFHIITMSTPLQKSLAQQIKRLNSVKNCTLTHEGVLSANLWSGAAVHIYIIDSLWKTRQIKKSLQDTSRLGIGALFIVDSGLLPPDGARLEPAEWLLALHELSGERIYTYRMNGPQVILGQVHFKPYGGSLREIWYGPDVVIAGLPFYRVWVKLPAVRGNWLIGNFGNELFWKQQRFRTERDAENAQQQGERVHQWASERVYGAYADRTITGLQDAKLEMAYRQLGLRSGAGEDETKAAFRKLARECHPDVSKLPKDEAERRFRVLREAYSYVRSTNGW
jgi:hypothetical protein